jgi:hypothetical protein
VPQERLAHVGGRDGPAGLPGERRERCVSEPAGVEEVVDAQVEVDVEGQAVARHPARAAHADRGDLALACPDAAGVRALERAPVDVVLGERGDQRLLERADVAAQVAAASGEVEDRVADELARAVVGRAPAAADLDDLDAAALVLLGRQRQLLVADGARAERDHRLVLEQHDRVGDRLLVSGSGQLLHDGERLPVGSHAELIQIRAASHHLLLSGSTVDRVPCSGETAFSPERDGDPSTTRRRGLVGEPWVPPR